MSHTHKRDGAAHTSASEARRKALGLARGYARDYVEYDALGSTPLRDQALRSLRDCIPPGMAECALIDEARREAS